MKNKDSIIVTTGDLKQDYEIIGPVFFQVSNKGIFSSALSTLVKQYQSELERLKSSGQLSQNRADWGFLYGEWSVGQNDFDKAFYISTQELKRRAAMLDADAVICMRQDIDLDTNGFTFFYLQMYGTAVRFIKHVPTAEEKAAMEAQKQEEEKRRVEAYAKARENGVVDEKLLNFFESVDSATRFQYIARQWNAQGFSGDPIYAEIEEKIKSKSEAERMYGPSRDPQKIKKFIEELRTQYLTS